MIRPNIHRAAGIAAVVLAAGCAHPSGPEPAALWRTTTHIELAPAARPGSRPAGAPLGPALASLPPRPAAAGGHSLEGIASYYWQDQETASGERFDRMALTAAHKTLPFGTRVRVTSKRTGRSVVVRINDRGPFKPGRVIDLSYAAAGAIGMLGLGLAQVRLEVVDGVEMAGAAR